ncbi:DedA family protein [Candidatus Enterovibrio altilux]|uniref:DedA family protein n=1 Tax=Candidatus Enterovibrio altilux TaxID=1927128 RepID=UPI001237CC74|nr:DedA family protein [Candidatus Enterovibrio luxaltus]
MFEAMKEVLVAIWHQDFNALLTPGSAALIYILVAILISLESGFLPAAPLPCDSIVILVGTLSSVGVLEPIIIFPLLIISASAGSWLAFLQGRWLNKLPFVQSWLSKAPTKQMLTVDTLLCRHSLVALFAARFVPVVRSILPMMMGMRVHEEPRFHYFSWLSASLWVGLLAGVGFILPVLPEPISHIVTMGLMAAPLITLSIVIITAITWKIRKALQTKLKLI